MAELSALAEGAVRDIATGVQDGASAAAGRRSMMGSGSQYGSSRI